MRGLFANFSPTYPYFCERPLPDCIFGGVTDRTWPPAARYPAPKLPFAAHFLKMARQAKTSQRTEKHLTMQDFLPGCAKPTVKSTAKKLRLGTIDDDRWRRGPDAFRPTSEGRFVDHDSCSFSCNHTLISD